MLLLIFTLSRREKPIGYKIVKERNLKQDSPREKPNEYIKEPMTSFYDYI